MSRITNTILSPSIPNPQYKKYLNGRLTLIIPSHPSRCESWNDYQSIQNLQTFLQYFATKLGSFTNFNMLFVAVVKDFDFFAKMKIHFKRGMVHCAGFSTI